MTIELSRRELQAGIAGLAPASFGTGSFGVVAARRNVPPHAQLLLKLLF